MPTLKRKKENQSTDETMRKQETEKGRNDGKQLRSHVRKANTTPGWMGRKKPLLINNTQTVFHTHGFVSHKSSLIIQIWL